ILLRTLLGERSGEVVVPSIAIGVEAGEAALQAARDGAGEIEADVLAIQIAGAHGHLSGWCVRGALGHDVDRATRRVTTEQRALRALQHFDALDVEEVLIERGGRHDDDAIDVRGDGLICARLYELATHTA